MGRVLVVGGAVLVVLGLLVMAGFPLFRLPGDFTVRRGPVTFYFPLASSILLEHIVHAPDDVLPALDPAEATTTTATRLPTT